MSFFHEPALHLGLSRLMGLLILGGLTCASLLADELREISPPGVAPRDAALTTLLRRMRQIVADRDQQSLEALMSHDFRVEFDVGQGPRVFRNHWHTESHQSPLWKILQRLLSLDGTFYSPTLYVLPYVYARFPIDLNPLEYVVAINKEVPLFAKPELGAEPVGLLQHSIVAVAKPLEPPVIIPAQGFIEVNHPDLGRCFVATADVYSPAGHRAFFEKRKGEWRWISLTAATLAQPPKLEHMKPGTRNQ
jgi:hypothetical protein